MYRYLIHCSFKGTAYHGWQIQPNAVTVQEVMENALWRILREKLSLTGCGRTDAGVHALHFYTHFETGLPLEPALEGRLAHKLNAILPPDIAVYSVRPVRPDVHARFSALSRTYRYRILTAKDAFLQDIAWHYHYGTLDTGRLDRAAAILPEYRDFACFSKKDTDIQGTHCMVSESRWTVSGHVLTYTITANRFLRNMVRAVVGTLLEAGRGKWSEEQIRQIIESRDRCRAGESVPACGLSLEEVVYPPDIYPD